ncbi:MAG: bifunctional (p)ppGpp synthetase/guanosine-3',5'-bis(diphosphate) 3'-pyrophosphohydrolase [Chloroflexi bacterium]|nr:bifunctional (p)ppGpp synthetase/guanosine-3',5'-bis(diphosphate) 3'-pyrophosphohydrolase [Chloroflexota bacterium]
MELGQGATIIDFAYAIHTGLGNQAHAAYVNDVFYPLNKPLNDGDQVRVVKKVNAQPQRAWLDDDLGYIATNYARSHARRWFRRLPGHRAIAEGQALVQTELNILGFPDFSHEEIAQSFGYEAPEQLYYAVGRADVLPTAVAIHVLEYKWDTGPARNLDNMILTDTGEEVVITKSPTRRLAPVGTCQPRPREPILGFMRKDGGLTCIKALSPAAPERGRTVKLGLGRDNP